MFLVFLVLFFGGLALFGVSFNAAEGWHAVLFAAGIISISLALAAMVHGPGRADSETQR